mmetsp:Transcript_60301/g.148318  ORF Transcript_60301/g.148318 Transcript_60301/m.148318 type:complete len:132 (+) Transcript_60301:189-584(+)
MQVELDPNTGTLVSKGRQKQLYLDHTWGLHSTLQTEEVDDQTRVKQDGRAMLMEWQRPTACPRSTAPTQQRKGKGGTLEHYWGNTHAKMRANPTIPAIEQLIPFQFCPLTGQSRMQTTEILWNAQATNILT